MAIINQSSGQGALFELVARGVKDNYFVKDTKDSIFPYDARYGSSAPHLAERKTSIPISRTNFGGSFEVEIDTFGDIMTECALEIDMPTWLPPLPTSINGQPVDPSVANNLFPITALNIANTSYGYVNGIGYFLFESIQLYQDQMLIQEWSGDGLYVKQLTEGSWNSSHLAAKLAGITGDSNDTTSTGIRALQMRATPGHLRVYLPLPGMQCPKDSGFPLVALPSQIFRIKGKLRKLEDLIVSTDLDGSKPAPWVIPDFIITYPNGTVIFSPKSLVDIGQPTILLSTVQHYISSEEQQELRSAQIEIPFRKQFENKFTFGELDYIPLDKGGQAIATRYIDGRHPTERVYWFFRNYNALDQNRLDVLYNDYFNKNPTNMIQTYTSPYGQFYYEIKLNIAGKEREDAYDASLWNQIVPVAKHEKYSNGIGSMSWSLGDTYGTVYPAPRTPEGTVNFTTADRPTMYIQLANIIPNLYLGARKAEMRVYTDSWNVYLVGNGRGRLQFAN